MRIAIDARELGERPTGVGRYLTGILGGWADLAAARAHEYVLCAPQQVPAPAGLPVSVVSAPGRGTMWEQRVLPALVSAAHADVLFAPGYTAPLAGRCPVVLTVHDVSFAAHPEWFSWREGMRRRLFTRWSARRAARIITVSDFSKREIVKHLGVEQSRVDVIYSGVTRLAAAAPHPDSGTDAAAKGPSGEALVLYVGSLFNRRHLPELVAAFDMVAARHPHARLELVGDNRTRPRVDIESLLATSRAADRIRYRAYLADDELAVLYRRARAFVFLSDYEGFALTPLEALGAGVPVVLLATEVAREVYGAAATYVERPEPALIAEALERALFDDGERARVLDAAVVQIQRYTWAESAQRTLQVLLAAARPM